jgi:predicted transposase/invertase (TIGR01784 family)
MTIRYINPYTDFGFKKLFAEEASKNLLIDFLNAVLPEKNRVSDLSFRPTEQLPENLVDRKAIFDIACVGPNGESFTVEMQKAKQRWFKDRALFYASFPIQKQLQQGSWDFELNPVFLVAVLDFEYDKEEEKREILRTVMLKDQNGAAFLDKLQMVFLQMPLFKKTESELRTKQDKWLYFLKNLESFDEIPAILREPVFEQAFTLAEWVKYPPGLQDAYRESQKIYWDNTNTFNYAIEEAAALGNALGTARGIAEGEARGEARGIVLGEARGKALGEASGRAKERTEIAQNLKQKGLDTALIAETTGLSEEEIERL